MSWFEAWLIWRLGVIGDVFEVVAILGISALIMGIAFWISSHCDDMFRKEQNQKLMRKIARRGTLIVAPIVLVSVLGLVIIPDTKTFFKIIATKYGADALTSQKAGEIGDGVLESIEKAQKLLNQKLDVLIDEKQVKEDQQ